MGKRSKLQAALENGAELTVRQIVNRFGYRSTNCARKDITRIRDQGVPVGHIYEGNSNTPKYAVFGNPRPPVAVIRRR